MYVDVDVCNGFVLVGSDNEVAATLVFVLALTLGICILHGRRRKVWPAACAMCCVWVCVRSNGSGGGGGGGVGVGEGVCVVVVVDEVSVSVSVVVLEGSGSGAIGLSTG